MSDFLYAVRARAANELGTVLRRFPGLPGAAVLEPPLAAGALSLLFPPHEAAALRQDAAHTTLVLGSPVVRLPGLPPAPVCVGERRGLLHAALADPGFWPSDVLDGAFLVLCLDHASGRARVITDRFNFIPAFRALDATGALVLGTLPEAVAHASGCTAVDPVSATDLAANLTCTFPYTLYRGVEQLAPGSVHVLPRAGTAPPPAAYWEPRERQQFASLPEAAEALRGGLRRSVAASCQGAERVGVLLSGGEDSRAVLAAVAEDVPAEAYIYADGESREVRVARAAATAYGRKLKLGIRPADHYARGFEGTAALLGSNHHFIDLHGLELHARLGLDRLPMVLGGLSADSLLKAVYAPARPPGPYRARRLPYLREELLVEVEARRNRFLDRLRELRPDSAGEWLVLWPFSMRKHGGNVDGNRRLFRAHEAFHATAVLEVAAAAPVAWKRHRRLYHRALRPLYAKSWLVPHAEYRFPYYGRTGNLLLFPALALARGARALLRGELRVRQRPWPRWNSVVDSPLMRARERLLLEPGPLRDLVLDGMRGDLSELRHWPPLLRLMLIQLAWLTAP